MSSNIDSNGLVASLSDKLDQNASLLLNTFDKLEDKVKAVGQERKIFLLERTRETLEKLHLIDEDSNLNNYFLKLNIEKVANNNKKLYLTLYNILLFKFVFLLLVIKRLQLKPSKMNLLRRLPDWITWKEKSNWNCKKQGELDCYFKETDTLGKRLFVKINT